MIVAVRSSLKEKVEKMKGCLALIQGEELLLSRVLYKNHNRFRNDKGYKDLRMLEKTVKKLLAFRFVNTLTVLIEFIPDSISLTHITLLPSIEMMYFTHAQLYAAGVFLHRIENLILNCSLLDLQRLNLGHFWGVSAHNLGIVSRIWELCRNVLQSLHICYEGLSQIRNHLPKVEHSSAKLPESLFHLMPKNMVKNVSIENTPTSKPILSVDEFLEVDPSRVNVDLGQVVKRCEEKNDIPVESGSKDVLSDIHSIDELKDFLISESSHRKKSRKDSFTRKLSQEQWKELKKDVLKIILPKKPNKSIKLCRKLIRSRL